MGSTIDDSLKEATGRPTLEEDWNEKEDCKRRLKCQAAFEIFGISKCNFCFWRKKLIFNTVPF